MKKRFLLILSIGLISFLFSNCGEEQKNYTLTGSGTGSAKINDSLVYFKVNLSNTGYNAPNQATTISFTFTNSSSLVLFFQIYSSYNFVGSYTEGFQASGNYAEGFGVSGIYDAPPNSNYSYVSAAGLVTINSNNQNLQFISGTFSFKGILENEDSTSHSYPNDTIEVTDGNFVSSMNVILQQ